MALDPKGRPLSFERYWRDFETRFGYLWALLTHQLISRPFNFRNQIGDSVTMPAPTEFLQFVDQNADAFIQRLSDAVAIPRFV